jgi:putative endonuclease
LASQRKWVRHSPNLPPTCLSLLYLAVTDCRVDGERLEGVGVTPDVEVEDRLPYAAGADSQRDKALDFAARSVPAAPSKVREDMGRSGKDPKSSRYVSWKSSCLDLLMAQWSVYVVRCRSGALYTGITTDVRRRISEHAQNGGRGAKYLRGKGPLRLVFVRAIGSKDLALRVESQFKKLRKVQKEELVEQFRRAAKSQIV